MDEEQIKKIDEVINSNPDLEGTVEGTTPTKEWLVNHVGSTLAPEDGNVTVEMIVDVMANEFPEFLMVVAEENWIRGYRQGLSDTDVPLKAEEDV